MLCEQIVGRFPKTILFLIFLEYSLVAKCNARFIKEKVIYDPADVRICVK